MNKYDFSITQEEFVNEFKELKDSLLDDTFSQNAEGTRLKKLIELELNQKQIEVVKSIFDDTLTDAFYTVIMALDGCASMSRYQVDYKLQDEEGNELTGGLDCLAYEAFHETET